ncbi:O-antigen ligase family protein [Chloroflexota bacterium]
MENCYFQNFQTRVKRTKAVDLLALLVGLATIYLWSDAATRMPVFTLGEWIRTLSPPLIATLLLVIVLIVGAKGIPRLAVSRPELHGNLPLILVVLASCLLATVGAISILNSFELYLALPIILSFTALVAVLIFSVSKIENALLTFFIILPILGFISLNLRTSLDMKGSVLILPAESIGISMPRTAWGQGFTISGMGHFVAMPSEVLFIGVIGLGFLLAILINRAKWMRTPLDWLVLGFVVVCLISSCFSSDIALSISYIIEGIIIPILLYYLIVNVVKTSGQLHRMLVVMFTYIILGGAYQLYQIYEVTGFSTAALSSSEAIVWKVRGTAVASDVFAGASAVIPLMPVVLMLCLAKGQRLWLRFWTFLALVLGYSTILFSFERGAWLASVVQIVLMVIFGIRVRSFVVVLALLVIFLGWLFGGGELLAGILRMRPEAYLGFGTLDESILCRFWTWGESFKLMINHPLTGIGLGTFPSAFIIYHGIIYPELWMQSAHNLFLDIGAEAGILALLLIIAIFALALNKGVSLIRSIQDTYSKNLILGLLVGVIGYIVVGVSTGTSLSYKHFILTTLVLWATMGLIMAYRNCRNSETRDFGHEK